MKRFGLLIVLLVLAIVESAVPVHLNLITALILLNFVPISQLVIWLFVVGFALDLLLANFLGVNFMILAILVFSSYFLKNFLWPNLNYTTFPSQIVAISALQVVVASRLYEILYNFTAFGIINSNFDLKVIPVEVVVTIIFFPILNFLSIKFARKTQLEIKF